MSYFFDDIYDSVTVKWGYFLNGGVTGPFDTLEDAIRHSHKLMQEYSDSINLGAPGDEDIEVRFFSEQLTVNRGGGPRHTRDSLDDWLKKKGDLEK